jgi:hypothetical protein
MPSPNRSPVALDVTIRWREDVLALRRLSGEASASVGDRPGALAPIPGAPEGGLVFARVSGGAASARVPSGEMAAVRRAGGAFEIAFGPCEIALAAGDAVDLPLGEFHLSASAVTPEPLPRGKRRAAGALGAIALAALAHAAAFGLAAQSAMASSMEDREDAQRTELRGLMASAELRARAGEVPLEDGQGSGEGRVQNEKRGDGRQGGGARAEGAEGSMGDRLARAAHRGRYAVPERTKNDPEPSASRAESLADASSFGMIGLLAQGPTTPSAWFADAEAHGADPIAARGELWARLPGESSGEGGLGLTGIGEGGGGTGLGIGLGAIGTLGHTDGLAGPGTGGEGSPRPGAWGTSWGTGRFGTLVGTIGHGHVRRGPWHGCTLTTCSTSVSGRLPPEAVQRIVRQNFGRFRACYEKGLQQNPALSGRVATRFVIDRGGAVASAEDGGSSMADPAVVSCVVRSFRGISFPQPEGGVVTVTYPITFSPT